MMIASSSKFKISVSISIKKIFVKSIPRYFCDKTKNMKKVDPNTNDRLKVEDQPEKIENFYSFMEVNMNKYENKNQCSSPAANASTASKNLIDFIKCPMTDSSLEICEEGLKVGHIIYPKRNGIYILVEEEAQFKF